MSIAVRIGGIPLHTVAPFGDVQTSTIVRREGWSGDYMMECSWSARADFSAPWFRRGALVEVVRGARVFGGRLAEPTYEGDSWKVVAYGFGAAADEWHAVEHDGSKLVPSVDANAAVDYAVANHGLPWRRHSNSLGSLPVGDPDAGVEFLSKLLDRTVADLSGEHYDSTGETVAYFWWVDSFGEVSVVGEPVAAEWQTLPGTVYMSTTDEEFVNALVGWYISSIDGVTGQPDGWDLTNYSQAAVSIERFGRRAESVDLTQLGLLTPTNAMRLVRGAWAHVGARMKYTTPLDLTSGNLRKPGIGVGDPTQVRANQKILLPGVADAWSPSYRPSALVTAGQVTVLWNEDRAHVEPLGFAPRDFSGALRPGRDNGVTA